MVRGDGARVADPDFDLREQMSAGYQGRLHPTRALRAIADLPGKVRSPAVGLVGRGRSASREATGADLLPGAPAGRRDGAQAVDLRPVAKLPPVIAPPAIAVSVGSGQRAGLKCPRRHRAKPAAARNGSGRVVRRQGADPQLTERISAPAVCAIIGRDSARIAVARADQPKRQAAGHGYGRQSSLDRAIADLAIGVVAPAVGAAGRGDAASDATARAHLGEGRRERRRDGHLGRGSGGRIGVVVPAADQEETGSHVKQCDPSAGGAAGRGRGTMKA
jgi:hypothetical protein